MAGRKPIPGFELSRTANADELAAEVEQAINDLVIYVNSPIDGKGKRIRHVQRGISDTDAVNVGQLRDAIVRGAANQIVQGPAKPGTVVSTAALHEFATFSLDDIEVPNPPFTLHCLTASVDETTMDVDRGTLGEAVSAGETAIDITGLPAAVDTGSYLLIHDPAQQSGTLTKDEIVYVASKSSNTYTVTRGRWGSVDQAHNTALYVFPIELRHFSQTGKSNIGLEDQSTGQPTRMDMYLPARCVVACAVFASNSSGSSGLAYQFLPLYSTDAEDLPLAPGMRTLMGQQYMLPKGTPTVENNTLASPVPIADLASIRCIYAVIKTAPAGADMDIDVNLTPFGDSQVLLESITIADGDTDSFASSSTNRPGLRRMPYGINWADLTPLRIDDLLQIDVTSVGSTTAGSGLLVIVQT
jgi:hypothetical protein